MHGTMPRRRDPNESVNAIVLKTKAAWDRADQKQDDAGKWYKKTGEYLIELKKRVGHGQWGATLKRLGRSKERAAELMRLADGRATFEEQRESGRQRVKKSRAKRKSVLRNTHLDLQPVDEDERDDLHNAAIPLPERWQ